MCDAHCDLFDDYVPRRLHRRPRRVLRLVTPSEEVFSVSIDEVCSAGRLGTMTATYASARGGVIEFLDLLTDLGDLGNRLSQLKWTLVDSNRTPGAGLSDSVPRGSRRSAVPTMSVKEPPRDDPEVVANPRRRARTPLTESQVDAIRTARANGESVVSISRRFGVHRMTVWTHTKDLL